ncbi:SDR family oxidoreductase [Sphingomonas sp. S1-29]|uniref:SDR family oxidoreductase n=1 Tax=Sphingomonas sp. S1-29 TaxID=2991074 RepID=UPI002240D8FB|nr:SDR family oxidoreductase [Sphingomonas sp. S1-29]UZK70295.1 SDR family oxidoreductase [Sphingomonas sp. S1-29]
MRLNGKRALVTAAGQGIGRAVAEAFVREGAEVIAADIDVAPLATITGMTPLRLDVTDRAAIALLPQQIGPIDILFNGAGVVHAGTILECSDAEWDQAFTLNVTSMFQLIRALLPGMVERGSGSIVNTASVASSLIAVRGRFAYGASKAAVVGLTKSVAADHVASGIRCNAICPGTIETPSLLARIRAQAERTGIGYAETYRAFADRQPIGRLGRVEEVAALAVYLASDESSFTTGTVSVIDGGWTVE